MSKLRRKDICTRRNHRCGFIVNDVGDSRSSAVDDTLEIEGRSWDIVEFFADRLKVQQREAGVRHDLIDAVFALGGEDDLVRLLARVHALQAFVTTEDGTNLLAGYKRAANILKKEGFTGGPRRSPLSYETPEPAEAREAPDRRARFGRAQARAHAAVEAEDFEGRWPRSRRCARRSMRSSTT
jgi:glycyl-tRNA synthetase beta subunit